MEEKKIAKNTALGAKGRKMLALLWRHLPLFLLRGYLATGNIFPICRKTHML